jgi:Uma2 family endonuclease
MTGVAVDHDRPITVAEFRAQAGDKTGRRLDLVNGRVRAQASPSRTHATVQNNLQVDLTNYFEQTGRDCQPVPGASIVPGVLSAWNERHPDIAVTCTPNDPDVHEVREPLVLIEILSPTNTADTWDNIAIYTTLPSVREILVLESQAVYGYL